MAPPVIFHFSWKLQLLLGWKLTSIAVAAYRLQNTTILEGGKKINAFKGICCHIVKSVTLTWSAPSNNKNKTARIAANMADAFVTWYPLRDRVRLPDAINKTRMSTSVLQASKKEKKKTLTTTKKQKKTGLWPDVATGASFAWHRGRTSPGVGDRHVICHVNRSLQPANSGSRQDRAMAEQQQAAGARVKSGVPLKVEMTRQRLLNETYRLRPRHRAPQLWRRYGDRCRLLHNFLLFFFFFSFLFKEKKEEWLVMWSVAAKYPLSRSKPFVSLLAL